MKEATVEKAKGAKKKVNGREVKSTLKVPPLQLRTVQIRLVGDTPLLCHNWDTKTKKQILNKQMGKASEGKKPKDVEADYRATFYESDSGKHGFPAIAFKLAAVRAAKNAGMAMTDARQAFRVQGQYVTIEGTPRLREDMVRLQGNTADIRHRAEFPEWAATLTVVHDISIISLELS